MAVNVYLMALMPISQAISWYMILRHPLFQSVSFIAAFYCVWALYNNCIARSPDLGVISMGILAVTSHLRHRRGAIVGTGLVLLNYLLPVGIVFTWSAAKLAHVMKKDHSQLGLIWAYAFKLYFVSNLCLWSVVLHKFWTYEDLYHPV